MLKSIVGIVKSIGRRKPCKTEKEILMEICCEFNWLKVVSIIGISGI
jgi:hypothetical protein